MADSVRHDGGMSGEHVARIAVVESQNRRTEKRLGDHDDEIKLLTAGFTTMNATLRSVKTSILAGVSIMGFLLAVLQIILRVSGDFG